MDAFKKGQLTRAPCTCCNDHLVSSKTARSRLKDEDQQERENAWGDHRRNGGIVSEPQKFRKRPVEIEAMQLTGTNAEMHTVYQWIEANTLGSFEPLEVIEGRKPYPANGVSIDPRDGRLIISTLEGLHWANPGDWIIRGVEGEFYPIKDSIFKETYERVEES